MDKILNDYLEKTDRFLKPVEISERADIIKEIKSEMIELQQAGKTGEEIVERLGDPKELAKAYLGDLLSRGTGFTWSRFLNVCAFYGLTGISGMFVIPVLGIVGPAFMVFAPLAVAAGLIEFIAALFGYDVPWIMFQFGSVTLSPGWSLAGAVITGAVLFFLGRGAWKLLLQYIRAVSRTKGKLAV